MVNNMIICVANTNPKKVKASLKEADIPFAMWKPGMDKDVHYGFFNFYDLLKSKTKKVPLFFNIVSAFSHIEINHPIYRYDFKELPNGLVLFKEPDLEELKEVIKEGYSKKKTKDIMFRPAKVSCYEGSELSRLWNNFTLTLPSRISEAFMVCFLQSVRNDEPKMIGKFIMDNRLVGTGNSSAYKELEEFLKDLWPALLLSLRKTEKAQKKLRKFKKDNPDLEDSISRFIFWNKSYKGKDLSDYMDEEDNVSYGITN